MNIQGNQNAYHRHSMEHTHDLSNHTHSLSNHTHSLSGHTHDLGNHTHDKGTYRIKGNIKWIQFMGGLDYDGPWSTTAGGNSSAWEGSTTAKQSVTFDTDTGGWSGSSGTPSTNTSGTPSNNTSGTPSNNTSGTPSNNTSGAASNSNTTYNGSSTDTESRPNNYSYIIWKRIA